MVTPTIKICSQCILPNTFPGLRFNESGLCSHCLKFNKTHKSIPEQKGKYRKKLDSLVTSFKGKSPSYDVIVAYSGGKDSSYTLKLLREVYDLRILALLFDNHFVSPTAMENIHTVTDAYGADLMVMRLPWSSAKMMFRTTAQKDIFSKPTLMRASSICTACIGIVKSLVTKTAIEMSIPMSAFGWSPGQAPIQSAIMKNNPRLIAQIQAVQKKAMPKDLYMALQRYYIPDHYYTDFQDRFPTNIHPLAFFDYNEDDILNSLTDMGWTPPQDTDTNSSNCMINAFANKVHIDKHGFHPYVWEIANMVRQGIIDRDDGIEKIYADQDDAMVDYAREKLGL